MACMFVTKVSKESTGHRCNEQGSVAEARFGIPQDIAAKTWSYLPVDMRCVMTALYRKALQ